MRLPVGLWGHSVEQLCDLAGKLGPPQVFGFSQYIEVGLKHHIRAGWTKAA